MASPTYTVKILGIATDGTNLYVEITVSDGTTTSQTMRPSFKVGTTAATITSYMQTIANNRPALAASIAALVGTSVTG